MLLFKLFSHKKHQKQQSLLSSFHLNLKLPFLRFQAPADSSLLLSLIKCYFNDTLHHFKDLEMLDKVKSQKKATGSLPERLFQKYHTHTLTWGTKARELFPKAHLCHNTHRPPENNQPWCAVSLLSHFFHKWVTPPLCCPHGCLCLTKIPTARALPSKSPRVCLRGSSTSPGSMLCSLLQREQETAAWRQQGLDNLCS